MKRSSLIAALLTIGLHAGGLALLSLWSVGGGDAAQAVGAIPEAEPAPTAITPTPAPALPDTVSLPPIMPGATGALRDSVAEVRTKEASPAAVRTTRQTQVTPVLMLSWQKGAGRRKTAGALPTLAGPLAADVTASFKVMVAPDGKVRSVRVLKGKDAAFERAAVARIKQWKFEPIRTSRGTDQLCTVTLKARAR